MLANKLVRSVSPKVSASGANTFARRQVLRGLSDVVENKFKITDLTFLLWSQLKSTKEQLALENKQIPLLTARPDLYDQRLEMSFNPDCKILHLGSHLLPIILTKKTSTIEPHMKSITEFYANPKVSDLAIKGDDGKSKLVMRKVLDDSRPVQVSVQLLKYRGFNANDGKRIIDGYVECFSSSLLGNRSLVQPSFEYDPKEALSTIPSEVEQSNRERELETEKAVQKLEALGVEVFDKASNELLTWDSLAGYAEVKRLIQDTIVNALQYPEIYDRVAARTRVVFESNRPKAVLFEGPPGTGKTLTARILASQCDRPLVLIQLESIMSKWFGESEKKLGQIFDACDELGGAIIFVDEIDALAPSRDSEQGIHESSKRILGILLQRIEGFHGKGKSLLVSATNRKQDLDKALLSRFDLMIQYPLPDDHTRGEIFKRYAKQFVSAETPGSSGGDATYGDLSKETEGLSCRAIKEICEQAERTCASRLVAAEVRKRAGSGSATGAEQPSATESAEGLSDSPTLVDYRDCIKLHRQSAVPSFPFKLM